MRHPKVSVIMSVYNGEKYLREAIDSILNQTFTDFEFIIINDGSTDGTREILESYSDPRVRLFHQENIGLTRSLNRALKLARGEYIARQDADDISLAKRLETQLKYFDADPSLTLCASRFRVIDENGNFIGCIHPTVSDKLLQWHLLSWHLLFGNQIGHASVMVKKEALLKLDGYALSVKRAQDYELWSRMSFTCKMIVIPDVLFYWRYHHPCISQTHPEEQWQTVFATIHNAHQRLMGSPVNKDHSIHLHEMINRHHYHIKPYTADALQLLDQIKLSFVKHYNPDMLTQAEIEHTVQTLHRDLFRAAIGPLTVHSIRVALYVFTTRPTIAIQGAIKVSCRLPGKVLTHLKKSINRNKYVYK